MASNNNDLILAILGDLAKISEFERQRLSALCQLRIPPGVDVIAIPGLKLFHANYASGVFSAVVGHDVNEALEASWIATGGDLVKFQSAVEDLRVSVRAHNIALQTCLIHSMPSPLTTSLTVKTGQPAPGSGCCSWDSQTKVLDELTCRSKEEFKDYKEQQNCAHDH